MKKGNILVIIASPRKNSNSAFAAIKLAKKIKNKKYCSININNFFLKPCKGCFKCSKTFKCHIKDEFDKILKRIKEANTIIVASPVYFTGVPGPFKIFIDRNQQQWEKYKKGFFVNPKKKGYIILTSGSNKSRQYKPAESEIKSFFAVNGIKCMKIFRFKNMDALDRIKEKNIQLYKR